MVMKLGVRSFNVNIAAISLPINYHRLPFSYSNRIWNFQLYGDNCRI
jgi:hypothetical protein